jgi:hypothetical protein
LGGIGTDVMAFEDHFKRASIGSPGAFPCISIATVQIGIQEYSFYLSFATPPATFLTASLCA